MDAIEAGIVGIIIALFILAFIFAFIGCWLFCMARKKNPKSIWETGRALINGIMGGAIVAIIVKAPDFVKGNYSIFILPLDLVILIAGVAFCLGLVILIAGGAFCLGSLNK
ncbi:MAG: hypothetical protein WAV32_05560 [Halobacteriota archaeon]